MRLPGQLPLEQAQVPVAELAQVQAQRLVSEPELPLVWVLEPELELA